MSHLFFTMGRDIRGREYSIRRDKSDRQKNFFQGYYLPRLLNETTYFHYNSLIAHKKKQIGRCAIC